MEGAEHTMLKDIEGAIPQHAFTTYCNNTLLVGPQKDRYDISLMYCIYYWYNVAIGTVLELITCYTTYCGNFYIGATSSQCG